MTTKLFLKRGLSNCIPNNNVDLPQHGLAHTWYYQSTEACQFDKCKIVTFTVSPYIRVTPRNNQYLFIYLLSS